jgi:signal transduction histidine kinase
LGTPIPRIAGSILADIVPEFRNSIYQARNGNVSTLEWISHQDQISGVFEITFMPDNGRGGVIGLMMDITEKARAESRMKRQSDLLAGMAENLPIVVGRIGKDGKIREIHGAGLKRIKVEHHEMIGVNPSSFYPLWQERLRQLEESEMISFAVGGHLDEQPWHCEAYLFKETPPLEGILFFALDQTGQRDVERKVLDAMEFERQRIGRDLHDGLGQQLTGISCLAQSLSEKLDHLPELGREAEHIVNRVLEAIEQARGLARGLCPVQIETMGLASALEDLAYTVERVHGKVCVFEGDNEAELENHDIAIHLFRIAQEAVHNAIKHSDCKKISILLNINEENGLMIIEDDGKGLSKESQKAPCLGFSSLCHRASLIGGTVTIGDGVPKGLKIECSFPIHHNPEINSYAKFQTAEP